MAAASSLPPLGLEVTIPPPNPGTNDPEAENTAGTPASSEEDGGVQPAGRRTATRRRRFSDGFMAHPRVTIDPWGSDTRRVDFPWVEFGVNRQPSSVNSLQRAKLAVHTLPWAPTPMRV